MPNRTVAASSTVLDHWRALTVPHTAATFAPAPHQWEYIRQRLTNPQGGYVLNIVLQIKGRRESTINVWFPFMYSQK